MKVMYFTIEGFDTPNANNHLAQTMIETLLRNGIEVYLLQSDRNGPQACVPALLANNTLFSYDNVKRKPVSKTNFIARYWEGIKYAFSARKKWKKVVKQLDAVIVQSTYLSWLSIKMLSKYKIKIIFSIFDLFPNVVFDVGASQSKAAYCFLNWLQKICYEKASKIVVITDDVKNKLIDNGISENKLVKIVNWFDEAKISEIDPRSNQFLKEYSLINDKFYVQYAGNFGFTFNYKYVIEVAKLLSDYKNIEFHMIGSGSFENEFKQEAVICPNIKFFPWQPLDIISDVYSACSIGLIPLSKGVIGNSFPSKMPLIMACHRTFVTSANIDSCYAKEVNDNRIGFCVSDNNPDDCAKAILRFYTEPELKKEYEDNACSYTYKTYGSSANAIKFVELLEELQDE